MNEREFKLGVAILAIAALFAILAAGCSFPATAPTKRDVARNIVVESIRRERSGVRASAQSHPRVADAGTPIVGGLGVLMGANPVVSVLGVAAAEVAKKAIDADSNTDTVIERVTFPIYGERPMFFQKDGTKLTVVIGPPLAAVAKHPDADPTLKAWLEAVTAGEGIQPPTVKPK
ncbi:hypothetical protein ACFL09_05200 [Planctomycetota bacterium]